MITPQPPATKKSRGGAKLNIFTKMKKRRLYHWNFIRVNQLDRTQIRKFF
ncbi:hypothetical protein MKX01_001454 [Papaver californicum]|nr:hypothetical protein MKX01_001454 [Papaver californicum]